MIRLGGVTGRWGSGSKDSIPGSFTSDGAREGVAIGGAGFSRADDWVTTVLSWLGFPLMLLLSGCHVRRRQASSGLLDIESRRDQFETVGEDTILPLAGEKAPIFEAFIEPGPNGGRPTGNPWGV